MNQAGFLGTLALAIAVSGTAHASRIWQQEPGCATSIAVGVNDVPWVVGCDNKVYYLRNETDCSGTVCVPVDRWVDANKRDAVNLAVNLGGGVKVTDASGVTWWPLPVNGSNPLAPSSTWKADPFTDSFNRPGCVSSFAFSYARSNPEAVFFVTPATSLNHVVSDIWGIACGYDADRPVLHIDMEQSRGTFYTNTQWQPFGAGMRASQIALVNESRGNDAGGAVIAQNPWVVADGSVYAQSGGSFSRVKQPVFLVPLSVQTVTDHFIAGPMLFDGQLGATSVVMRWSGDIYGNRGNWVYVAGSPPSLLPIKQLAAAAVVMSDVAPNAATTVGPSGLWSIDVQGNIYQLVDDVPQDPTK